MTDSKTSSTLDPTVERVIEQLRSRSQAGKLKYGTDLTRGDLSHQDWLQHLQEELMDAANYVQALKDRDRSEKRSSFFYDEYKKQVNISASFFAYLIMSLFVNVLLGAGLILAIWG